MLKFFGTLLFALLLTNTGNAQSPMHTRYQTADSLLNAGQIREAYTIFKDLESTCDKKDTLYGYILWYYTGSVSQLEKELRMAEKWEEALLYAQEALTAIQTGNTLFPKEFAGREYWMYKNIIVSYFGLNKLAQAKPYQEKLYKAYKAKKLPEGLEGYYNFEFFRRDGKNVWGYEWYPELGDPETQGSFSKIVYYVYSTNADGSDKDQLYRLHVLKFHKLDNSVKFDYVLTKRLETATQETSGTLYAYTYDKNIDMVKLRKDIREVLQGKTQPDTKTVIQKQ